MTIDPLYLYKIGTCAGLAAVCAYIGEWIGFWAIIGALFCYLVYVESIVVRNE